MKLKPETLWPCALAGVVLRFLNMVTVTAGHAEPIAEEAGLFGWVLALVFSSILPVIAAVAGGYDARSRLQKALNK